jgi:hypothetical protein
MLDPEAAKNAAGSANRHDASLARTADYRAALADQRDSAVQDEVALINACADADDIS